MTPAIQEESAVHSPSSTELAVERTWLAHERTMMAWVRTATSMISFGFTIYKFFQFEQGSAERERRGWLTPRDFALILISIALVALLTATIQNRIEVRTLRDVPGGKHRRSLAVLIGALVSIFGILVLLSAVIRA
jgi:putative membrane protein